MLAALQNRLDGAVDGDFLIVAGRLAALGAIGSEQRVGRTRGVDGLEIAKPLPEFIGRWIGRRGFAGCW